MTGLLITALALASLMVLAYRRVGLAAFGTLFTLLVAAYLGFGAPAPAWGRFSAHSCCFPGC